MQPKHSVRPDDDVLFAWREGLAEAASQDVKQQLLQREGELLPRFAAHYDDLTHLPRSMRRRLQRHWKRSLAGLALLLALGQMPAMAATINVRGACTLVRAIVAANNDTTATGHCTKGSGADRIVMPRNSTVTLTAVNNTNYGPTGLPTIRTNVTIDGNGSTVRRASTAPEFRIFAIDGTGDLRLQEATVSGGMAVKSADPFFGGGLFNCGALTLANSTVSGNRAFNGGGVHNYGDCYYRRPSARVTIIDSTISGNSATRSGGGVYASYGSHPVTVTNSTVSGNKAARYGGGLSIGEENTLRLNNSAVSANTAGGSGGGIFTYQDYTDITLNKTAISGNIASRNGGGVYVAFSSSLRISNSTLSNNIASGEGGGVHIGRFSDVDADLVNTTISGNVAAVGGGVFNDNNGEVTLTHSTISGNAARVGAGGGVYNAKKDSNYTATLNLVRTIVSGNAASSGREVFNQKDKYGVSSIVTAADFNVFGHKGLTNAQALLNFTPSGTDTTATSNGNRPTALNRILNTTLADNGGPTRTHSLVAGSPAVDAVNNGTCPPPARDQRGVRRPQDGNGDGGVACDIGSFERR